MALSVLAPLTAKAKDAAALADGEPLAALLTLLGFETRLPLGTLLTSNVLQIRSP